MEEGVDYYINPKGQYVFTEVYLEKRGHCCLLSCLHCPYGHNKYAKPYFDQAKSNKSEKSNAKK
jgi:hypothetical protein